MAGSEDPPDRTVLASVTCPACNHFAAFKIDAAGDITYGEAVSYRCAIMACAQPFEADAPR